MLLPLLLLLLAAADGGAATTSSTAPLTPSIYELLPKYGLPPGLLPDSVTAYSLAADGAFSVTLAGPCYVNFEYLVYYAPSITGVIKNGGIEQLKGIQVRRFLVWLDVDAIKVDSPPSNWIYFRVGLINKQMRIDQFEVVHSCNKDGVFEGARARVATAKDICRATDTSVIVGEKEARKTELEKKLQVLNDKKHHLVQMLKQILHTEEEIKRRSSMCIPASGFRASIPIQPESAVETGSVTRHAQKLSVDVNFGGDLGGEVDVAATNSNTNVMNTTSPASLTRPKHGSLHQNTVLHNPRASAVAVGHGQPSTPSSTRSLPPASASPFSPTINQSHAASSTPMSVPGTSFAASTPSPASGGVSSVFRDSRLASSL